MRICQVHCHVRPMAGSWLSESVIANPLSGYPEYWEKRSSWFGRMTAAVIELVLDDGTRGYGFVGGGKGELAPALLDAHLRPLLLGRDVRDTALVQQLLHRATLAYGRGGLTQQVISGIDIACWDAHGRCAGQPVHALLGRPARQTLRAYYTGYAPGALAAFGLRDMKIAVPYGPAHGEEGMRLNVEAVSAARDVLGPHAMLALDIYMAWTVDYTLRMYDRLEPYHIAWLEEPVLPDDYEGYREIRSRVNTMVAGGEHEYTLAGFRRLIDDGCVDLVQPDIYRAGGPTALQEIAAHAVRAGLQLICHGVGSPTYHFLSTLPEATTPFVEYVDLYRGTTQEWVLTDDPRPAAGLITLTHRPGFGYSLTPGDGPVATIW